MIRISDFVDKSVCWGSCTRCGITPEVLGFHHWYAQWNQKTNMYLPYCYMCAEWIAAEQKYAREKGEDVWPVQER